MGWTLLSANSICEITRSSKNSLDRRYNEKKNSEKNEMSRPENAKKGNCELCWYPRD